MTQSVDIYFAEGCGRCPLGKTPDCKVHLWTQELELLREIVLQSGLQETCKWGVPCYTYNDKNVVMISAFKNYCCISFFKGALLQDTYQLLTQPGPNSQAVRLFQFTKLKEIQVIQNHIEAYIQEAIEIEKAGLEIPFKKELEPLPEELVQKFEEDPSLKSAFESLTPGRQRGFLLHFSQPKQSATRISRIEKCTPMILSGIGLHDKYKSTKK
ncbi:MAG: YdeI/OmpD-associated family protein [Flavobacteriales bacterium]|nr:YdeI/OmpD-associated family protein [Flavobacteriales bacterium]